MDKGENKEAPGNPERMQGRVYVHSFNDNYTEVAGYLLAENYTIYIANPLGTQPLCMAIQ